jgi:hypothetical protein
MSIIIKLTLVRAGKFARMKMPSEWSLSIKFVRLKSILDDSRSIFDDSII